MWPFKKYTYRLFYRIELSTRVYSQYIEARNLEKAIEKLKKIEDPFTPDIISWEKY